MIAAILLLSAEIIFVKQAAEKLKFLVQLIATVLQQLRYIVMAQFIKQVIAVIMFILQQLVLVVEEILAYQDQFQQLDAFAVEHNVLLVIVVMEFSKVLYVVVAVAMNVHKEQYLL